MTTSPTRPTVLTARSPEDLLAAVPVVLGFEPEDSVVMLTFGGPGSFHARVDLPADPAAVEEVVGVLLDPARRHRVGSVLFVLYTAEAARAASVAGRLRTCFSGAGIAVLEVLRADGRRWFALPPRGGPSEGVPYDVGSHPFRVGAVLAGAVTHRSRADLARTLAPDPTVSGPLLRAVSRALVGDRDRVRLLVERGLARGRLTDAELAELLVSLAHEGPRGGAWSWVPREEAAQHVRLWSDALRRSPRELVPGVASVLAFTAWRAGDGALAWCAVDRCREVDPRHPLARLVATCLEHAVPPSTWDESGGEH